MAGSEMSPQDPPTDIRLTFDRVPAIYDRVRPSYPAELIDQLFARVPDRPRIFEMGPGTGQLTRELLARQAEVTAVELGPNLAQALHEKLGGEPGLTIVNDSFEEADVELGSFDAVAVATAYHWIGHQAQVQRPIELLRPSGVLAVIDLIQVESPVTRGYFERVQPIYDRYHGPKPPHVPQYYDTAEPPVALRLRASGLYDEVEVFRVPWDQTYSSGQYRDLLLSYSGTQMMPEPAKTAMVDELVAVIDDELGGVLTRPLVATLTLGSVLVQ